MSRQAEPPAGEPGASDGAAGISAARPGGTRAPAGGQEIEFHRHGVALVPDGREAAAYLTYWVRSGSQGQDVRRCSCPAFRRETCPHVRRLVNAYQAFLGASGGRLPEEAFRASVWHEIGRVLGENSDIRADSLQLEVLDCPAGGQTLTVRSAQGQRLVEYLSREPDALRFADRLRHSPDAEPQPSACPRPGLRFADGFHPSQGDGAPASRGLLLDTLAVMTLSAEERVFASRGFRSRRQTMEESLWYRLAYHGFREFGSDGLAFEAAVEEPSGAFTVCCKTAGDVPRFRMFVPAERVRPLLTALGDLLPNQHGLRIHPVPLRSIFKISLTTDMDLDVRPVVQLLQEHGEATYLEQAGLERYRYGDLVYVKELGVLAELETPGRERRFTAPGNLVLKKTQVPSFLQEHPAVLDSKGPHLVEDAVKRLRVFTDYDRVEIEPESLDRDGCRFSARCGAGETTFPLAEVLCARREGRRYLTVEKGWVDCHAPVFEEVDRVLPPERAEPGGEGGSRLRLAGRDLFRFRAAAARPVQVVGRGERAARLRSLLELKPLGPPPSLAGLASPLRGYQTLGMDWLRFLYENRLGGLLCDEMGLGKTHQVLALMLALREQQAAPGCFLVVCPVTVLSHWDEKIRRHAPGLEAALFHGGERDLEEALRGRDVIITSYGVLRNDIEALGRVCFGLAVFDEIQCVKNPATQSYEAARGVQAEMKVGLTGTPIENRLGELKAMLDLTLPGYLGTDQDFALRFDRPDGESRVSPARETLRRLIFPFTLRRLKKTVLEELPAKIEDVRTCRLSEAQVRLYREAVESRGGGLRESLLRRDQPIPYLHVFALLGLLKQICDHPALAAGRPESYEQFESGKWELFRELLEESLDSGQKVAVYSQYLGMIRIVELHLEKLGVGHVSVTGASRNRGRIVQRFNEDPGCRVYVGSLKAGGVGIDLTAASVVIHYDRWWNAAREDQATDRVHRIGQTRGVQVFKLVTEGTLEEKISAMIEKKRNLLDEIVREDDPGLLKTFSREELLEFLTAPP